MKRIVIVPFSVLLALILFSCEGQGCTQLITEIKKPVYSIEEKQQAKSSENYLPIPASSEAVGVYPGSGRVYFYGFGI